MEIVLGNDSAHVKFHQRFRGSWLLPTCASSCPRSCAFRANQPRPLRPSAGGLRARRRLGAHGSRHGAAEASWPRERSAPSAHAARSGLRACRRAMARFVRSSGGLFDRRPWHRGRGWGAGVVHRAARLQRESIQVAGARRGRGREVRLSRARLAIGRGRGPLPLRRPGPARARSHVAGPHRQRARVGHRRRALHPRSLSVQDEDADARRPHRLRARCPGGTPADE